MKIELDRTEMRVLFRDALSEHLGSLARGREINAVDFKTYPYEHIVITLGLQVPDGFDADAKGK